jgi:hypothetical protein
VEERQSGVNALAFVFAKCADEVLLAGLSAMLAHLEDLDEVSRHLRVAQK